VSPAEAGSKGKIQFEVGVEAPLYASRNMTTLVATSTAQETVTGAEYGFAIG
jgi:hypothetical protein